VSALDESYLHCGALAREHKHDHWIAALFAPEASRKHLHALAAFAFETERIGAIVKEPFAGEVRLTWWLEAVEGLREGEAAGHPVAAALTSTIGEAKLPKSRFEAWLLARRDELYSDAEPSEETGRLLEAPLYALGALALDSEADEAALRMGEATALLALEKPADALARLDAAQAALVGRTPAVMPAFAPLAALRLDARRSLKGSGPAPGWRRQIAMLWWGRGR
jgi:phytoene/squalene synthetase